jgi:dihydropteroate synthase
MMLRARGIEFTFPRPAILMGIVNVTPDSFSDGGAYLDPAAAVEHGVRLAAQGAEILDIGGESSRPGASPVSEAEEKARVVPVIRSLAERVRIPLSIDTTKPGVAETAIKAGASIVNDIGANRADERMWKIVAETGAGYVCMHAQGTPQTMQEHPRYQDVVGEVGEFFSERIERLRDCGVSPDGIIVDPGIGFGKTLEHNLSLLGALQVFARHGRPVLVGISRKSFIGTLLGTELAARLPAALACASLAVEAGVQIIRAHDVRETLQAVRMVEAIKARRKT